MNYRSLGRTNLKVSEVGYGTWQFANDDECWVGATKDESQRALLAAIDNGVNFIDTARSYGDGLAEEWIGEFIKLRAEKELIISSKVLPKNWQWPARKGVDIQEVFPKQHIINQVEGSLKALKREYLDIMLFHVWQDEWVPQDEWKETIVKLTKEGKVRFWGISTNNHESSNCLNACDTGLITVVETIFNVFFQEPIQSLFPYIKQNNIGLIARVPLDEGGLSGNLNSQTIFEKGDFRKSYFSPDRLVELEKRTNALKKEFLGNEVQSLPELALRYILSFNEISTVIPGMRKVNHVIENTEITNRPKLDTNVIAALEKHAWNRNFYGNNPWES